MLNSKVRWVCLLGGMFLLSGLSAQDREAKGNDDVMRQVRQDQAQKDARKDLKSETFKGSVRKWIELGHAAFSQEQYSIAVDRYLRAYEKEKDSANRKKIEFLLGQSQQKLNHPKAAVHYYSLIWKAGGRDAGFLRAYTEMLFSVGDYQKAQEVMDALEKQGVSGSWLETREESIRKIGNEAQMQEFFGIYPEDIRYDTSINTSFSEYGPSLVLGQLFFASSQPGKGQTVSDPRTGQGYSRIYSSTYDAASKSWGGRTPLEGDLASLEGNVGTFSYDSIRNIGYFTWNQANSSGIYTVQRQGDGSWGNLNLFSFNYKAGGDDFLGKVAHPSVSKDGNRLLFVYRDGASSSSTDIWYVERVAQKQSSSSRGRRRVTPPSRQTRSRNKQASVGQTVTVNPEWGLPVRYDNSINTPGREAFPYWVNDSSFIFASDGHVGVGGMDLYLARLDGRDRTKVRSVSTFPMPVNSSYDDNSLIVDPVHKTLILSSNRYTTWGKTDNIFLLDKWGSRCKVSGRVFSSDSVSGVYMEDSAFIALHAGEPVPVASIHVGPAGSDSVLFTVAVKDSGYFEMPFLQENSYEVRVEAPGYKELSGVFNVGGDVSGLPVVEEIRMDVLMEVSVPEKKAKAVSPAAEPKPAPLPVVAEKKKSSSDLSPSQIISQLDNTSRYIPGLDDRQVDSYKQRINDPLRRARLSVVPATAKCEVCGDDPQWRRNVGEDFYVKSGDDKALITLTDQEGRVSYIDLAPNSAYSIQVQMVGNGKLPKLPDGISRDDIRTKVVTRDYILFECAPKLSEINDEVYVNNVYFDFDKSDLIKDGPRELDRMIIIALKNPQMYFQIEANADERGSDEYNLKLTDRRLKTVTSYVEQKGMDMRRVIGRSYGERNPLIKNAVTENEHRLNRRTTFRLINPGARNIKSGDSSYPVQEVAPKPVDEVRFMVQIGAFRTPLDNPLDYYSDIVSRHPEFEITYYMDADGLYKYNIGTFYTDIEDARSIVRTLLQDKRECYVSAFYKGQRITVSEAIAVLKRQGK